MFWWYICTFWHECVKCLNMIHTCKRNEFECIYIQLCIPSSEVLRYKSLIRRPSVRPYLPPSVYIGYKSSLLSLLSLFLHLSVKVDLRLWAVLRNTTVDVLVFCIVWIWADLCNTTVHGVVFWMGPSWPRGCYCQENIKKPSIIFNNHYINH